VKKQKKAAREKKQILKKNKITRISLPAALAGHPQSSNVLVENRQ
jgi:hypothetical protein